MNSRKNPSHLSGRRLLNAMIGYLGGYKFILSLSIYIYILYHDIPNLIITIGDWVWWSQGYQTSQYRWESRADFWPNWWPWLWGEDLRKTPGCGPTEQVCLCLDCRLLGRIDTFSKSWRWSRDQKARVLLVIFSLSCTSQHHEKQVNIHHRWTFMQILHLSSKKSSRCSCKHHANRCWSTGAEIPMLKLWSSWSPWKSNDLLYRTYEQDMQW